MRSGGVIKFRRLEARIRLITSQIQERKQTFRDISLKWGLRHGEIVNSSSAFMSGSFAAGLGCSASLGTLGYTASSSLRSPLAAMEGPAVPAVRATITKLEGSAAANGLANVVGSAIKSGSFTVSCLPSQPEVRGVEAAGSRHISGNGDISVNRFCIKHR